jgi:hypothetical protein
MLRDKRWKFTWVGIIVLGLMLLGIPLVYAGDMDPDPADVAYQQAEDQGASDLEEIAANRDAVIEELVQMWFMDEPGWEDEFRVALSQADDSELLAIKNAKSYAQVQAILSGGTPDDFNAAGPDTPFALGDTDKDFVYTPVNPCRIIDTRKAGGKISTNTFRNFWTHGDGPNMMSPQGGNPAGCPSPRGEPRAVHMNIVAVNSNAPGWLTVWPKGTARPLAGVLNYHPTDKTDPISNAFTVKTGWHVNHEISVYAKSTTHVVADVMGYYYEAENLAGAEFAGGDQSIALGPAATTVRSIVVSAPASGRVIVNASGYMQMAGPGTVDFGRCSITTGTVLDFNFLIPVAERAAGAMFTVPFGATRGFNVGPGNTTFRLVCDEFSGDVRLDDSSLTGTWVPRTY